MARIFAYISHKHGVADDSALELIAAAKKIDASATPTAIVTGGDLMALGVIRGLSKIGLSVPDDVAVIGSDGIDLAPYIDPPLTTVLSNFFQAARRATDLLLDEITSPGHKHEETVFPTELLVRRSCGYFADRPGVPTEVAVSNLDELVGIAGRRPLGSLL